MVRFINKELSTTRSSPMKVFHGDELHRAISKTGINKQQQKFCSTEGEFVNYEMICFRFEYNK